MTTTNFQIGQKVNHVNGGYLKNGIVTGIDINNNRVFVKWPQHGDSSIPSQNLLIVY